MVLAPDALDGVGVFLLQQLDVGHLAQGLARRDEGALAGRDKTCGEDARSRPEQYNRCLSRTSTPLATRWNTSTRSCRAQRNLKPTSRRLCQNCALSRLTTFEMSKVCDSSLRLDLSEFAVEKRFRRGSVTPAPRSGRHGVRPKSGWNKADGTTTAPLRKARCRVSGDSRTPRVISGFLLWEVPDPKGVVVFSHGHGVHATFELLNSVKAPGIRTQYKGTWVEAFNKAGYSVFAMDHQGHGRSDFARGKQCYFERIDNVVQDYSQFVTLVRKVGPELPSFMLGMSMGGFVVVSSAIKDETGGWRRAPGHNAVLASSPTAG